jgi:sugar phosphate isomerase/epimerase
MKNFKSIPCLIAVVLLLSCAQTVFSQTKKASKNIGLQLYSLRDDISKDFDGTVQAAGSMGYKYVEAANYSDGKFYGMSPQEYKSKIEKNGMIMLSSHTAKGLDSESPDWDEIWKWWDQCIDAHAAAGAKYIVTPWMTKCNTLDELKVYCDYYNQIGEKCKKKGLKFGYHNHDFELETIEDKIMLDYMLENTNPDLVFFQMDVYWVVMGRKSPVDYFKKYPGRFELLHIKDHKELGESGMVGFDAIFKYAKEAGVKYLIVEVEQYDHTPKESVKLSFDYLINAPFVKADYSK